MVNSQPESVIVEGDATLNSLKSLGGGPVLNDSVNLWVVSCGICLLFHIIMSDHIAISSSVQLVIKVNNVNEFKNKYTAKIIYHFMSFSIIFAVT